MTYQKKNAHELLVEEGLKELVTTIVDIAILYGLYKGSMDFDISIDFDDSIAQDRQENFNYYSLAADKGLMPKVEAIKRIFKVPEETAVKWLEKIIAEGNGDFTDEDADMFGVPPANVGE